MSGWVKLHRKIEDNPILRKSKRYSNFEAFIWLLLRANYDQAKVVIGSKIYNLKKGQLITSQKKICKKFGWGNSRLKTFLKLLKNDGMIEVRSYKQLTMITLLNWESYQETKSQKKHKRTTTKSQQTTDKKKERIIKKNKENEFINKVAAEGLKHVPMLPPDMIDDFCNYWTERNMTTKKMRYEMEKTFDISRRLSRWKKNSIEFNSKLKENEIIKEKDDLVERRYRDQMRKQRLIDKQAPTDQDFLEISQILKGDKNEQM